jgi:hypothetical protein
MLGGTSALAIPMLFIVRMIINRLPSADGARNHATADHAPPVAGLQTGASGFLQY